MPNIPDFEEFETHAKLRAGVRGSYNGHDIEVATGYDIASDSWPVHVYVDGRKPLGVSVDPASSYEDAVKAGVAATKAAIESQFGIPGLPPGVRP